MIIINKEIIGENKRKKEPVTPSGYVRITTGKIHESDEFWNWNAETFDYAFWLKGQPINRSEQYIIRKAPVPIVPKHTWSKKLAALVVSKEKT